ncbi:MAG TPA: hypothetical protein VK730_04540 [Solirubrobacteraceae bacterium]|jgi:hypothetical protein|nr:hypothetical protein [Solirubrobacteraceae bacterium]
MLGERATRQTIADGVVEYQLTPEQAAMYAEVLSDESMHVTALVRQMSRIASFLCSMHWSVVEFPEDWLISCDQPVVFLPYVPSPITLASAITPQGLAATLPGYGVASAASSGRRQAVERIVFEMIEDQTPPSQMRWVRVDEGKAFTTSVN